jgi:hypothetical protein
MRSCAARPSPALFASLRHVRTDALIAAHRP